MNTTPSVELTPGVFTKAVDSATADFVICNPTSSVMNLKFSDDGVTAPVGVSGSIPIYPGKCAVRANIEGFPYLEGQGIASITS